MVAFSESGNGSWENTRPSTGTSSVCATLQSASEEAKKDKQYVRAAVEKDGLALQHAAKKLRRDKKMVLASVKQNGLALQFASKELREEKKIVLTAIKQSWRASECFPERRRRGTKNGWCGIPAQPLGSSYSRLRGLTPPQNFFGFLGGRFSNLHSN